MCSSQPPADSTPTDPRESREKPEAREDDPQGSALPAAAWLIDGYNVLHTVLLGGQPREGTDWWGETGRDLLWERIQSFDGLHRPESAAADLRPDPGNAGPDALEPGTVWIVAHFNNKSYKPLSREGGLGQIAWPAKWPVTYLYPIPGMAGLPKWGAFVVRPARTLEGYASPGYLPPCSGGQRHKYSVDIMAVDENGEVLARRRNVKLGKY